MPFPTKVDDFIGGLSDVEFSECVRAVLDMNSKLTSAGRDVYLALKRPRESRYLRQAVYDTFSLKTPRLVEPLPDLDDLT